MSYLNAKTNEKYYPLAITAEGVVVDLSTKEIRKQCLASSGYMCFNHTKGLGTVNVHRMLAEIWIDNPYEKEQVNHINGVKTDNYLSNLEWVTRSENALHAHKLDLLSLNCVYGEDCNLAEYSDEIVHAICKDIEAGLRNVDIVCKYGVSPSYPKYLKAGKLRTCITSQYNLSKFKNSRILSEQTVRWICNKIVEGLKNKEILNLSTNPKVTLAIIKQIRSKKTHRQITQEYF